MSGIIGRTVFALVPVGSLSTGDPEYAVREGTLVALAPPTVSVGGPEVVVPAGLVFFDSETAHAAVDELNYVPAPVEAPAPDPVELLLLQPDIVTLQCLLEALEPAPAAPEPGLGPVEPAPEV